MVTELHGDVVAQADAQLDGDVGVGCGLVGLAGVAQPVITESYCSVPSHCASLKPVLDSLAAPGPAS
ncbi:hypothetical protein D3C78_1794570 [compost metagenome]